MTTRGLACTALSFLLSANCATTQRHGPRFIMSEREQVRIGRAMLTELESNNLFLRTGPLPALVQNIGNELVPLLGDSPFAFRFEVLDSPALNAFALPGGTVIITRGLLQLINRRDELVAVLAHELGHVAQEHAAWRVARAVPVELLAASLRRITRWAGEDLADTLSQAVTGSLLSPYAQEQEREADRVGVVLAASAGYDAAALATVLARTERLRALVTPGPELTVGSWNSHPPTEERLALIRILTATVEQSPRDVEAPATWLCALDASAWGQDAGVGILQGRHLPLPALGVALDLPESLTVAEQDQALVAVTHAGRPLFRLWRQMPNQAEATLAALRAVRPSPVVEQMQLGATHLVTVVLPHTDAETVSRWVWLVNDDVAVVLNGESLNADAPLFAAITQSIRALTPAAMAELTTARLRIVPGLPDEPLLTAGARFQQSVADTLLTTLNDAAPQQPAPQLLKVVRDEPWIGAPPYACH